MSITKPPARLVTIPEFLREEAMYKRPALRITENQLRWALRNRDSNKFPTCYRAARGRGHHRALLIDAPAVRQWFARVVLA